VVYGTNWNKNLIWLLEKGGALTSLSATRGSGLDAKACDSVVTFGERESPISK